MDKQFPFGLITVVCLKPVIFLLYRDRIPRRKITLRLLRNPQEPLLGVKKKIPTLVKSSINVVRFIFVHGEPSRRCLTTELQSCCLTFPCVHAFFPCSCHEGFFIWELGVKLFRRGENEIADPQSPELEFG